MCEIYCTGLIEIEYILVSILENFSMKANKPYSAVII